MKAVLATDEKQLEDAFTVRTAVFIEEQNVPPELELDELEDEAVHFVLYDDSNNPCGAGRFRTVGEYGKVERICVLKEVRGKGAGNIIMEAIEQHAAAIRGLTALKLNAQVQAIPFYEKRGYTVISEEFLDAGIVHKTMTKPL
ncbi:GNAT family N-acetyltransferase [Domibacillus epiphyticus]|uniref:GNAT family N-acetyltransferase n=1 Tax=Domibacillus epiphyticus TaxID=1714355 RepID=A0A1V2A8C9_9BACI|nr:GNAT family N-acetyltransferase [Domibacillus epiphyticus]OMP67074.1 GNAT family N-acetyltransferase [Domibacillus epiphyticus]